MSNQCIERPEELIAKIRHDLHILDSGINGSKLFATKESRSDYLECRILTYPLYSSTNLIKLNKNEKNRIIDNLFKADNSGDEVPRLGFLISDKGVLTVFAWY